MSSFVVCGLPAFFLLAFVFSLLLFTLTQIILSFGSAPSGSSYSTFLLSSKSYFMSKARKMLSVLAGLGAPYQKALRIA